MATEPSKSAVRKAGSALRRYVRGDITSQAVAVHEATIIAYRNSFSEALETFQMHLVNLQNVAGIDAETTSRLKRIPTIREKLIREDGLDLSRMQDIGGCRSVVNDIDELYRLRKLVLEYWECREKDYIQSPRPSGYRAIHLIADCGGKDIELQLRTPSMHRWAETVEAFSSVLGVNYKQDGTHPVQQFLRVWSEMEQADEKGHVPPTETNANFKKLSAEVNKLLEARRRDLEEGSS